MVFFAEASYLALWVQSIVASLREDLDVLQELLMDFLYLNAQHSSLHASHLCLLQLAELNGGLKKFLEQKKQKKYDNFYDLYWFLRYRFYITLHMLPSVKS